MRSCKICLLSEPDVVFNRKGFICYSCYLVKRRKYALDYYRKNSQAIIDYNRDYKEKNKEEIRQKNKKYTAKNRGKRRVYIREYSKSKRKTDIHYRIRCDVSRSISRALKLENSSKFGESFMTHVSWTIDELKQHLESQFEPWMNWSNRGSYGRNWNDNDTSTWT